MTSVDYFVTMTLKPMNADHQLFYLKELAMDLWNHKSVAKMSLVIECHKSGNLHAHALISFIEKQKKPDLFLKRWLYRNGMGNTDIQVALDYHRVRNYMLKEMTATKSIIKMDPLFYDDYCFVETTHFGSGFELII